MSFPSTSQRHIKLGKVPGKKNCTQKHAEYSLQMSEQAEGQQDFGDSRSRVQTKVKSGCRGSLYSTFTEATEALHGQH